MEWFTSVVLPADYPRLAHSHRLMLLGSCFATGMGERLLSAKFRCDVNPYGVLYNPLSIGVALRQMMERKVYVADELYCYNRCWHSAMHHGDFSAATPEEALRRINARLHAASDEIYEIDFLLLTFGSSVVYEDSTTGNVVANCHKLPEVCFRRRRLSVGEIKEVYLSLLADLFARNAKVKVYLTVSPIRYLRDGLHESQLSKATLLLAVDEICRAYPQRVFYFPAYEMLMDELRDYRFYADDMVHPSEKAVDYVWKRFCTACIRPDALPVMNACRDVQRMLQHRPFRPSSDEHKRFLEQIVLKIDRLIEKYPYLDFQKERELCRTQLIR